MAVRKQMQTVPLVGGADSRQDPKQAGGKLLTLENAKVDRHGEVRKRYGSTALTGSPSDRFMSSYNDKPVLVDSGSLRVFDGSTYNSGGFDTMSSDVALSDCGVEKIEAVNTVLYADVAERSGIRVVTYADYDADGGAGGTPTVNFHAKTYDLNSGQRIDELVVVNGATTGYRGGIRCVDTGERLLVVYCTITGLVAAVEVNTSGGFDSPHSTFSGGNLLNPDYPFDICAMGDVDNSILICGRENSARSDDLRVLCLDENNNEQTATSSRTAVYSVGCYKQRDEIVAVIDSDTVAGNDVIKIGGWRADATLNNAEATVHTASQTYYLYPILAGGRAGTDTDGVVFWTQWHPSTPTPTVDGEHAWQTWSASIEVGAGTGSCAADPGALLAMGTCIHSKPMTTDGSATNYLWLTNPSGWRDQVAYHCVSQDGLLRSRVLHGYAMSQHAYIMFHPASPHELTTSTWRMGMPHRSSGSTDLFGVSLATFDSTVSSLRCRELDKSLVLPTHPQEFDGKDVTDIGFSWYPPTHPDGVFDGGLDGVGLAITGVGSVDGEVGYRVVYEWLDAQGRRHQSAAGQNWSITAVADEITVTVPTLSLTNKNDVRVAVYRTIGEGGYYYRVGDVENDPTATYVQLVDNVADSVLVNNERLYAQTELENIQPGNFRVCCVHQDRLFYAHREWEETRVFYSKTFLPNTGMHFNEGLVINVSPDGGVITALESFNDRLVIFKKDMIYATYGNGYNAVGGGSNYQTPQLISPSVGCTDQKLVVRVPQGLMFMSRDGVYLMDNNMQVQGIGHEVDYWTDNYTYDCSTVVEGEQVAIWMSDDANTPAIWFNYDYGIWGTHTNRWVHDCVTSFDGNLYWTAYGGNTVYVEDSSTYLDGSSAVPMRVRFGWLALGELGGFQRVYRAHLIGQNISDCNVRIKTFYDYDPVVVDNQVFSLNTLGGQFDYDEHYGTGLDVTYKHKAMIVEFGFSRQQCRAVMLEIVDESPDGDTVQGQALSLSALAMEVGVKGKLGRKDIGSGRRI